MKQTTNYKFNKPELTDLPDITQLNSNFDTIDAELKAHSDEIKALDTALDGKAASSHSHAIGDLPLASVAEAKAGSIDTKVMTPAKAKESAFTFGMATKGTNPVTSTADDTPAKWKSIGAGVYYFNTNNYLINQPSAYGFIINYVFGDDIFQLWKTQSAGYMYYRSGTAVTGWGESWTKCANTADLGAYLPLDGSKPMEGSLQLNSKQIFGVNAIEFSPSSEATHGGFLDFHFNGNAKDYTSRIIENAEGSIEITAPNGLTRNGKTVLTTANGLPLAGGTMSGAISRSGNLAVNTADNSYMQICGGKTSANGGTVAVYGVGHSTMPGAVVLTDNGDTPVQLQLANGKMTYGGKEVLTEAGSMVTGRLYFGNNTCSIYHTGTHFQINAAGPMLQMHPTSDGGGGWQISHRNKDDSGNVWFAANPKNGLEYDGKTVLTVIKEWKQASSWGIKFSNGFMIQGGKSSSSGGTITFAEPFLSFNYPLGTGSISASPDQEGGCYDNLTLTSVKVYHVNSLMYWAVAGW